MPGLLRTSGNKVSSFQDELKGLNKKILKIDNSACDVYNETGIIQASVNTKEVLSDSIEKLKDDLEEFIIETAAVDNSVASLINKYKNDFYEKYSYLKPESEKSIWEKVKDKFKKAGEWCKEHWKEILIGLAFIVVGAILTALTGGAFLPALLAGLKAALIAGMFSGGLSAAFSIVSSIAKGEKLSFSNIMKKFGDGFASGFMMGGIFSGASMMLGSGLRIAVAKSSQFASKLLSNGKISEFLLKRMVPAGAKNTFVPSNNITSGYKYDIQISKLFGQSSRFQLKWHSIDLRWLGTGANTGSGWTAQIQIGRKYLTTLGTLVNRNAQNITHIPIIP